jgi:hypothetical protein
VIKEAAVGMVARYFMRAQRQQAITICTMAHNEVACRVWPEVAVRPAVAVGRATIQSDVGQAKRVWTPILAHVAVCQRVRGFARPFGHASCGSRSAHAHREKKSRVLSRRSIVSWMRGDLIVLILSNGMSFADLDAVIEVR